MTPYRDPSPPPATPREPFATRLRKWAGRNEGWLIVAFVGAVTVLVTIAAVEERRHPRPPLPCSAFAEWAAKDVPARCTRTYDPDGGQW